MNPLLPTIFIFILPTTISLCLLIITILLKINWSHADDILADKIVRFFLTLIPIFNLLIIVVSIQLIIKSRKPKYKLEKEEEMFNILKKINLKYIEKYLRKKKLDKIK